MPNYDQRLAELAKQALDGLSSREVSERTGLSHTTIALLRGRGLAPRPETLARLCDGMQVSPEMRAALFEAAGLIDPLTRRLPPGTNPLRDVEGTDLGLDRMVIHAYGGVVDPEDLELIREVVRSLVEQRRRQKKGY